MNVRNKKGEITLDVARSVKNDDDTACSRYGTSIEEAQRLPVEHGRNVLFRVMNTASADSVKQKRNT